MKLKGKVVLEGLEFHAYHGIYPDERSSGNKFEVDISVDTFFDESAFHDELSGTINYEDIYAVVKTIQIIGVCSPRHCGKSFGIFCRSYESGGNHFEI